MWRENLRNSPPLGGVHNPRFTILLRLVYSLLVYSLLVYNLDISLEIKSSEMEPGSINKESAPNFLCYKLLTLHNYSQLI